MTKEEKIDYAALNTELEQLLDDLQSGDLSIDEALKAYERGQAIVRQLQAYLKSAENKVKKITSK
jgi:exodeoxyribonuclease VII small subunit